MLKIVDRNNVRVERSDLYYDVRAPTYVSEPHVILRH